MSRFSICIKVVLILLYFFTGILISQEKPEVNFISSSTVNSILLKGWLITKDISPNEPLKYIHESLWKPFNINQDNKDLFEGNWLIKINFFIKDTLGEKNAWGLFPQRLITAYEIYWDGIKIGQNGKIGKDKSSELAGAFNYSLLLPSHLLTPGKHTIILRISNYRDYSQWKWFNGILVLGPYKKELENIFGNRHIPFFVVGFLLVPFVFNLFLYFVRKGRVEHLIFSLICLTVFSDYATGQYSMFANVSTTYIHAQVNLYRVWTIIVNILFPVFFIYTFLLPKKTIAAVILIDLFIFMFFTNFWNIFRISALSVLIISSLIIIWALYSKREGSIIIFCGIIIAWISYIYGLSFAGLVTVMAICTSFSIAMQFARKEKAEREAQLRSTHLENELLKKNINPHFILNSLTSVIAWLRKEPASAIKLIEALADEFRMVSQISNLKIIPICQEIDICRTHLRIMNYRKDADFKLIVENIDEDKYVPPMIFHTLIENGLSHGFENKDKGIFTIQQKRIPGGVQYILSDDGNSIDNENRSSSGFGIKYIKGRLEESYPGLWKFTSQKTSNGWENIIEIMDK